jgi:succinoglycan biosynthesis protein ExoM
MSPDIRMTRICVCICTYKRPGQLDALLWALRQQETEGLFSISIIVVDNDSLESARSVVEAHFSQQDIMIEYFVEPQQNIARARNRAIKNHKGDFIALIDDDELPGSRWLLNLFWAIDHFRVSGILGPVFPRYEKTPPKWVLQGHFFERPTHVSGYPLEWQDTRTGNVLLKSNLFEEKGTWFRPEFGSGGEDKDFFKRMIRSGLSFVWCNEAPVFELVPQERWKLTVMVKRALLRGKMGFISSESKYQSILFSLFAIFVYSLSMPMLFLLGSLVGWALPIQYVIKSCDHLGKLLFALRINLIRESYIS